MLQRSCLYLSLLAVVAACSTYRSNPQTTYLNAEKVILPTEFNCSYILVEASVNQSLPRWFLLDTGSNVNLLDANNFPTEDFQPAAPFHWLIYPGGFRPTHPVTVDIGGANFREVSVLLAPDEEVFLVLEAFLQRDIAGIVGINLFSQSTLEIDYQTESVAITKNPLNPANGNDILPVQMLGGVPMIKGRIGDRLLSVHVDTGYTLGPPFLNSEIAGLESDQLIPVGISQNIHGNYVYSAGRLNKPFNIGNTAIHNMTIQIAEKANPTNRYDVIIGGQTLKHFSTIFDVKNKHIQFRPHTGAVIYDDPYFTTGVGIAFRNQRWLVGFAMDHPEVEASGIRVGDEVISINNQAMGCKTIMEPKPESTHLTIMRDGEEININLPSIKLFTEEVK